VFGFAHAGTEPLALFACLVGASFFGNGVLSLLTGPIATEAVPAGLTSSAIGLCSGAGELLGGGLGSILAGYVAKHYGIDKIPLFTLTGIVLGVFVSLLLRETAPRKVRAAAGSAG
jgi:sugar phosphate permease